VNEPRLCEVRLLRDQVEDPHRYPFTVPALVTFARLALTSQICFFVGENGSGKSTLLEAIAVAAGFGAEGGSRNFSPSTSDEAATATPLADALRLSWSRKLTRGFFLRAESFFNVATAVDDLGVADGYGGRSLHQQSHGESFLSLVEHRFSPGGLYLLDEPEAAVSPQRQLTLLALLHHLVEASRDTQLIIATHSPILLALPGAQIVSFDGDELEDVAYEDVPAVQVTRSFLQRPEWWLERLL
jgi:predicted ATPase